MGIFTKLFRLLKYNSNGGTEGDDSIKKQETAAEEGTNDKWLDGIAELEINMVLFSKSPGKDGNMNI